MDTYRAYDEDGEERQEDVGGRLHFEIYPVRTN